VDSTEAALRAVDAGECDAAVNIDLVARNLIRDRGLDRVERTALRLPGLTYKYHMAVRRGETAMLRRLNEAHFVLHERGEFGRLHEKWIGPLKPRELTARELQSLLLPALAVFSAPWAPSPGNGTISGNCDARLPSCGRASSGSSLVLQSGRHSLRDRDIPRNRVQRGPMLAAISATPRRRSPGRTKAWPCFLHPDDSGNYGDSRGGAKCRHRRIFRRRPDADRSPATGSGSRPLAG